MWSGGQEVLAVAYDVPIPGYHTKTTNNLRLWDSQPKRGFDLNSFNGTHDLFSFVNMLLNVMQRAIMSAP